MAEHQSYGGLHAEPRVKRIQRGPLFEIGADGSLHIAQQELPDERRADVAQACLDGPTLAISICE